jgi:outer membrane protein W
MQFFKKKLFAIVFLFATQGFTQEPVDAQGASENVDSEANPTQPTIDSSDCFHIQSEPILEAKVGYFFFASSKMRQVYEGGLDVQLSSSTPVWQPHRRVHLNVYGSLEFLRSSGHSTEENYKTYVWELPINLGLKPVFLLTQEIQYYLALGPRYFFIRQHNSSPYVDRHKSKNGVGLFVNTGFNFILCKHLAIDLFGEYSYAKTHFHTSLPNVYTQNIQIGGFTFGAGLGYSF